MTVENLFDNVPARRKFLKKDATETQAVAALAERLALSRPDIAFSFIADGRTRFSTAGDGDLLHTLYALYGREFASRLIKAEATVGAVTVWGYTGLPDNARSSRSYQHVFVNGRYVHSKTAAAAIERAYTSYMAPEKFPVCALFITVLPNAVDVNVHPAKLEVKFSDERTVFEAVYYALRNALTESTQRPTLTLSKQAERDRLTKRFAEGDKGEQVRLDTAPSSASLYAPQGEKTTSVYTGATSTHSSKEATARAPVANPALTPKESLTVLERTAGVLQTPSGYRPSAAQNEIAAKEAPVGEKTGASEPISAEEQAPSLPPYRLAGQLFDCYILVELEGGTSLIIDQHAAHERILFEELKRKRQKDKGIAEQELLIPLSLALSPEELATAKEYQAEFAHLGFSCRFMEGRAVLTGIPVDVKPSDAEGLFVSMCFSLQESSADPSLSEEMRREKMLYQIACKAAIKGGRKYDESHLKWLVEAVLAMPDITVCPHGRPIAFVLTKKEIDRRFERLK